MALTFLQLAEKALLEAGKPLSGNDLWQFIEERGYAKELNSKGKTPWASLYAGLHVDIRDNPASLFESRGVRPKLFALKSMPVDVPEYHEPVVRSPQKNEARLVLEKDLHPLLVYFCYNQFGGVYAKTIKHHISKKTSYGEWVHPDVMGCTYTFQERDKLTASICELAGQPAIRLFSFELKRSLDESSLRESFFQAVSNSSWANEGYLAAANISKDNDFRKELERLSSAFGIGVIELDMIEPDDSAVLFPAHAKDTINLDGLDKLISMDNKDIKSFFESIKRSKLANYTHKDDYDKVLDREDLLKLYKDKN